MTELPCISDRDGHDYYRHDRLQAMIAQDNAWRDSVAAL